MGMPIITPGDITKDQAVTDLIQSISLQESALSHIMNAESEKMEAVINTENVTKDELFILNKSIESMINAVTELEMMLQSKLEIVSTTFDESNINQ